MTHSFTINQDVEETRRLEAEAKNMQTESRVEDFCLRLFLEASDRDPARMMAMLDVFAAKMIVLCASNPEDAIVTHARHIATIVSAIKKGELK